MDIFYLLEIIKFYIKNEEILRAAQGPGKWNDPDMVILGREMEYIYEFGTDYRRQHGIVH
jgi:hypothetical protein